MHLTVHILLSVTARSLFHCALLLSFQPCRTKYYCPLRWCCWNTARLWNSLHDNQRDAALILMGKIHDCDCVPWYICWCWRTWVYTSWSLLLQLCVVVRGALSALCIHHLHHLFWEMFFRGWFYLVWGLESVKKYWWMNDYSAIENWAESTVRRD